jgi:hypothetical protein
MKVLYFQISTTANSTSGYYPGYPNDTPFTINGQSVSIVANNPYDAAIEADPLADYNNYPSDWTSGIYVENGGTPYYWTRSYVSGSATFTQPSDYGQAYQNGDFKWEVAIVPDTFTLSPPPPPTDSFTTVGLSSNNVTTFSGSVADTGGPGIATVKVYNGMTLLGTATVTNGTWTLQTTLGAGTYSQLNVVSTDVSGTKATANSPISLVANATAITAATFNQGSTGTLDINGTTMPTTVISGFAPGNPGDIIDLTNVPFDSSYGWEYVIPNIRLSGTLGLPNRLYITENGTTYTLQLGVVSGGGFQLSDDDAGGTKIQLSSLSRIDQIKADLGSKPYTFGNVLTYIFKEVARSNPGLDPNSDPYKFSGEAIDRVVEERIDWDATANADPILSYVDHYLTTVNALESGLGGHLGGLAATYATVLYYSGKLIINGIAKGVGVLGSFIGSDSLLNVAQFIRNIGSTSQYPTTDPSILGFSFAMQGVAKMALGCL